MPDQKRISYKRRILLVPKSRSNCSFAHTSVGVNVVAASGYSKTVVLSLLPKRFLVDRGFVGSLSVKLLSLQRRFRDKWQRC